MTRAARPALKIDVRIEAGLWKNAAKVTVRQAVAAAADALSTSGAELAILLTDDSTIRLFNRQWRGIDAATNVLSFPSRTVGGAPPHIGDIVLAYETIAREAGSERKPFAHHVAHLAVHGYLHLMGYDHERQKEANAMEAAERKILRRLAIPDPYGHNSDRHTVDAAKKPTTMASKKRGSKR
jgi:probable rRNA maturation factor